MELQLFPYPAIPFLSKTDLAYIQEEGSLSEFYKYAVSLESFRKVIDARKEGKQVDRVKLTEVINKQYDSIELSVATRENILKLKKENTFTICTAHQPCLFTGPLYFIYKIASTIHLASLLEKTYKDVQVVPVFVMGGEDHDFDEICHATLYGKRVEWDHPVRTGPVGRLSLEGIDQALADISAILGNQNGRLTEKLKSCFTGDKPYGKAMIDWVNFLFKEYGLVIINMDHPELKRMFVPVMEDDLVNHTSQRLVKETQDKLESAGYNPQAFVRAINLFYFKDGDRIRIELENGRYTAGNYSWTKNEILLELNEHPDRFSPNVVLRPLYQETVLPNLAYIGGGGELAYWIERKSQFDHYQLPYPMLIRRNSVLWLNKAMAKNLQKAELEIDDLFVEDIEHYISNWVASQLDISLEEYRQQLRDVFENIQNEAIQLDKSLEGYVGAEQSKAEKSVEQIEKRMVKAAKSAQEVQINRIRKIYQQIFPGLSLQERKENFLPVYSVHGKAFLDYLVEVLNPLEKQFMVISE